MHVVLIFHIVRNYKVHNHYEVSKKIDLDKWYICYIKNITRADISMQQRFIVRLHVYLQLYFFIASRCVHEYTLHTCLHFPWSTCFTSYCDKWQSTCVNATDMSVNVKHIAEETKLRSIWINYEETYVCIIAINRVLID